jgi:hypothetical protein
MQRLVRAFAICFLSISPAWSQVDMGQISGTVTDNTNGALPGVKVTVIDEGNKVSKDTTTNGSGYYTFPNLPVGTYTVTAETSGFAKYSRSGIHLDAASQVNASIQMSLGSVTQTVNVSETAGEALALEPSTNGTVTAKQFQQLEVNGRNPVYLALLEPGGRRNGHCDVRSR